MCSTTSSHCPRVTACTTNPLRVIPYGESSEVVFTLRRQPGMTDEQFNQDTDAARADRGSLKRTLETH